MPLICEIEAIALSRDYFSMRRLSIFTLEIEIIKNLMNYLGCFSSIIPIILEINCFFSIFILVSNIAFLACRNDQLQEATMKDFNRRDTNLFITRHARSRMQQRCFKQSDIYAIVQCGTAINDHEILFTNKDVSREIGTRRQRIKVLTRKMGKLRINRCGTLTNDDRNAIQGTHLESEIRYLRQEIQVIDRLKNRKVIIRGNKVITCYACNNSEHKRISRMIH
jgi:hypothetical protein